jgi:hypothetical protein
MLDVETGTFTLESIMSSLAERIKLLCRRQGHDVAYTNQDQTSLFFLQTRFRGRYPATIKWHTILIVQRPEAESGILFHFRDSCCITFSAPEDNSDLAVYDEAKLVNPPFFTIELNEESWMSEFYGGGARSLGKLVRDDRCTIDMLGSRIEEVNHQIFADVMKTLRKDKNQRALDTIFTIHRPDGSDRHSPFAEMRPELLCSGGRCSPK